MKKKLNQSLAAFGEVETWLQGTLIDSKWFINIGDCTEAKSTLITP